MLEETVAASGGPQSFQDNDDLMHHMERVVDKRADLLTSVLHTVISIRKPVQRMENPEEPDTKQF